ncbi:hypothetical protein LINPERHAP1_LOCUS22935, partial [Linum perenne]
IQPKNINGNAPVDEGRKGEVFGVYYPISEVCKATSDPES